MFKQNTSQKYNQGKVTTQHIQIQNQEHEQCSSIFSVLVVSLKKYIKTQVNNHWCVITHMMLLMGMYIYGADNPSDSSDHMTATEMLDE